MCMGMLLQGLAAGCMCMGMLLQGLAHHQAVPDRLVDIRHVNPPVDKVVDHELLVYRNSGGCGTAARVAP